MKKKETSLFDYEEIPKAAYSPDLARNIGNIKAAIFLSQLLFYIRIYEKRHGQVECFFKKRKDFEKDTALRRREQEQARKILRDKGLITERHGKGNVTEYQVNYFELDKYLPGCRFGENRSAPNRHSRVHQTAQPSYETYHENINETTQGRLPFLFMEEIHKKIIEYRWPWKPKNWKPEKDKEAEGKK